MKSLGFKIQFPESCRGSYILGSFCDWLFLVRVVGSITRISLFNPFSRDSISLPDVCNDDDKHMKMFLSVVPTDPKCICVLLNDHYESISICTPTAAKRWHKIYLPHHGSVLYHAGNFYFPQNGGKMVIIKEMSFLDILKVDAADDGTCCDHIIPCTETQTLRLHSPSVSISKRTLTYLLESCGEILLVRRSLYVDGPHQFQTSGCEIYRLDLDQMAWVKFETLGDHILFLGMHSSRSFSATKLVGDDALANFGNNHTWFMSNKWKWRCFDSKFDHWLTAPIWWCLKEKFSVESRTRRSGRTKKVPSHLANYIV